jgi:hypothetical protein
MHNFGQQVSRSGDLPGCLDGVGHALLPSAWGGAGAAYEKTGSTWCLYICSKILYSSGEIFACKHCAILLQWKNHCGIQTSGHIKTPTISLRCYIWNRRITAEQSCRENEEFASYMTEVVCRRFVTSELATRRKSFPASRA